MIYKIDNVLPELAYSRKTGIPMIKLLMYEGSGDFTELLFTHYLLLDHNGKAKDQALRLLRAHLKNQDDYELLKKTPNGLSCEAICCLMQNNPEFFNKINEIEISDSGKYRELLNVKFAVDTSA